MEAFKRVVENMMNRYGGEATVYIPSVNGTYNANTSEYVTTTQAYIVKAIVLDLTLQSNGLQTAPNTLVQAGDKQVFVQPIYNGIPLPKLNPEKDTIQVGSDRYNIVTVKQINPSGADNALLELYVRK